MEGDQELCGHSIGSLQSFSRLKNLALSTFLHMKVGEQTSFALMVMLDIMFPEKISVGRNTVIGYNTTILAHEYLIKEYRLGEVKIGSEVMIGANTTILPGVTIGDGAVVSAGTLVNKDVPAGAFVGGNPMVLIREDVNEILGVEIDLSSDSRQLYDCHLFY